MSIETNNFETNNNAQPEASDEQAAAIARGQEAALQELAKGEHAAFELPENPHTGLGGGIPDHTEALREYRNATSRTVGDGDSGTRPSPTIRPEPTTRADKGLTSKQKNDNYKRWLAEERRLHPKGT